jgi:hypothetical protein
MEGVFILQFSLDSNHIYENFVFQLFIIFFLFLWVLAVLVSCPKMGA